MSCGRPLADPPAPLIEQLWVNFVLDSAHGSPFGGYRTAPTADDTDRGHTGHLHTDGIGLIYMNARFYVGANGRFASADTLIPDPGSSQGFNRYSYSYNNPINFQDPSGHNPICNNDNSICSDGAYDDTQGQPFWWISEDIERVDVEGYGLFDKDHLKRGYKSARWLFGDIERAIAAGGDFVRPRSQFGDNEWFFKEFYVPGNVAPEDIEGIAWAIYMDFETAYESFQLGGGTGFIGRLGGFAPEDLPSNYVGFWAYTQGYALDDIPHIVAGLGRVTPYESLFGPIVFNVYGGGTSIAKNQEFLPMVPLGVYANPIIIEWQNVSWPEYMHVNPTSNGPATWVAGEQGVQIRIR